MLAVAKRTVHLVAVAGTFVLYGQAANLRGEIKIDARFSKRSIAAAPYDLRGMEPRNKDTAVRRDSFERVAVWLEPESPTLAPVNDMSLPEAVMQQRNRHFAPSLLVVAPGTKVVFPNLDPIFHNIFSFSPTLPFDLGYYAEGKSRKIVFPRPGVVQIYCHVHPEMYGVIVVTPSRWTARPAADGTFSFADVPPGRYKVLLWQRAAGLVRKLVVVPSSGDAQVSFIVPQDQDR